MRKHFSRSVSLKMVLRLHGSLYLFLCSPVSTCGARSEADPPTDMYFNDLSNIKTRESDDKSTVLSIRPCARIFVHGGIFQCLRFRGFLHCKTVLAVFYKIAWGICLKIQKRIRYEGNDGMDFSFVLFQCLVWTNRM